MKVTTNSQFVYTQNVEFAAVDIGPFAKGISITKGEKEFFIGNIASGTPNGYITFGRQAVGGEKTKVSTADQLFSAIFDFANEINELDVENPVEKVASA